MSVARKVWQPMLTFMPLAAFFVEANPTNACDPDQGAVAQADEGRGIDASIRTRPWSVVSTVLPRLMTCLGPRTEVAGLLARIPPVTSQSNNIRIAARCCLTVGFAIRSWSARPRRLGGVVEGVRAARIGTS
jgi:hypothetical protein